MRSKNVTHTSARKLGPSTIVASRVAAPSAEEAGRASAASEEIVDVEEEGQVDQDGPGDPGAGAELGEVAEESDVAADEPHASGGDEPRPSTGAQREEAKPDGLRCARCGRGGVEVSAGVDEPGGAPCARRAPRARPVRRTGGASCTMTTSAPETSKPCPLPTIGTTLRHARCRQPARIERMKESLSRHGQITPLIATTGATGIELVDGFKRLAAAEMLAWPTLVITVKPMDETGQWATMLLVNRGPSSMTTLEEALVLREMAKTGLLQSEIAGLVTRHKTWVSRRIGLLERLHPELLESMKLGVLHPGSARRLLSLPPGNQLEMAAAIQRARLGPRDTELLVGLWRRTKDPPLRRALLSEPRASLRKHHPETRRSPLDPRLSPEGQRLCRALHRFEAAAMATSRRLGVALTTTDRAVLSEELLRSSEMASRTATELGSARSVSATSVSEGSDETS